MHSPVSHFLSVPGHWLGLGGVAPAGQRAVCVRRGAGGDPRADGCPKAFCRHIKLLKSPQRCEPMTSGFWTRRSNRTTRAQRCRGPTPHRTASARVHRESVLGAAVPGGGKTRHLTSEREVRHPPARFRGNRPRHQLPFEATSLILLLCPVSTSHLPAREDRQCQMPTGKGVTGGGPA